LLTFLVKLTPRIRHRLNHPFRLAARCNPWLLTIRAHQLEWDR